MQNAVIFIPSSGVCETGNRVLINFLDSQPYIRRAPVWMEPQVIQCDMQRLSCMLRFHVQYDSGNLQRCRNELWSLLEVLRPLSIVACTLPSPHQYESCCWFIKMWRVNTESSRLLSCQVRFSGNMCRHVWYIVIVTMFTGDIVGYAMGRREKRYTVTNGIELCKLLCERNSLTSSRRHVPESTRRRQCKGLFTPRIRTIYKDGR